MNKPNNISSVISDLAKVDAAAFTKQMDELKFKRPNKAERMQMLDGLKATLSGKFFAL